MPPKPDGSCSLCPDRGQEIAQDPKAAEGEDTLGTVLECGLGLPHPQHVPEPQEAESAPHPVGAGTTPGSAFQPWWVGSQCTSGRLPRTRGTRA